MVLVQLLLAVLTNPMFLGGILLGIIGFFVLPLLASAVSSSLGSRLADRWCRYGMQLLGRALLIKRKHGGYWLKRSSFDAQYGKEKTTINGEPKHFEDPENLMSRLYGWPFALAHAKSGTIIDPRFAELGEYLRERARTGSLVYDDGDETYVNGHVRVADDDERLVNPDHAIALVSGDAEPGTTDWSIEVTKHSQSPFAERSYIDYIGGIVAYLAPVGACWALFKFLDTGAAGGGGPTVPVGALLSGVVL